MTTTYKLAICRFPGGNSEHPRSSEYVMGLLSHIVDRKFPQVGKVFPLAISDTPISMSRNRAVRESLRLGADYILMIDSDLHPDLYVGKDPWARPFFPTAWDFLMKRRSKEQGFHDGGYVGDYTKLPAFPAPATVAAPYCGPAPDECVYVFQWTQMESDAPDTRFKLEMIPREAAAIRTGFQEVPALPTGLILYDARVFTDRGDRSLPKPWFDYEYSDEYHSNKSTTEDVYQTRNASLQGMPQFVLWDSWAGHIKLKTVGKPGILTNDAISEKLKKCLGNPSSKQRLTFLRREDAEDSVQALPDANTSETQ